MESAISWLSLAKGVLSDIPVPGLPGAFDALLEVAKIYKQVKANKDQVNMLCDYVQSLHQILEPLIKFGSGKSLRSPLHERLEQFSMNLIACTSHLETIKHFTWWGRIIHRSVIARTIARTNESISTALDLFRLGGAIRQEDLLDKVAAEVAQVAADVAEVNKKFDILNETQGQDKHVAASFEASPATTCLEGTRVALLRELHAWATGGTHESKRFCWLNGPLGAGKSTVAKTMATQLKGYLAASFFFSRDHASRRNPHIVIPTLARQLASFNPAFRQSLAKSRAEHPDVHDGTLELQLQHLIITPLKQMQTSVDAPWVIILDALDECEGQTSASSATEILGLLAQYVTQIPPYIRFLITSRPEAAMTSAFDVRSLRPLTHTISLHSIDRQTVADDIRLYVHHELTGEWAEREKWNPDEEDLEGLVVRAEGLFIFAATSIKLIKSAPDAGMRLADTLHRLVHPGRGSVRIALTSLDMLYLQILDRAKYNVEVVGNYRRVVGAIVYLRYPLSSQGLADLLRLRLDDITAILRPLRSVFMVPSDNKAEIHFYHKSFRDFVMTRPTPAAKRQDQSTYDYLLFYDRSAEELRLAEDCLLSMDRVLHRNMSGHSDLLCLNADIPDLESRMEVQLPSYARYACLHWAFHLPTTMEGGAILRPRLEHWCRRQMLFWLEVLSLCNSLDQAIPCLYAAEKWYKKYDFPKEEVVQLLKDGQSFVRAFFRAIQDGASHIYQSGIPFAPDCPLLENYHQFSNNCVKVIQGRSLGWSPVLWSADGHTDWVTCIAFSPDGTRIASGSRDCHICLWSSNTGKLLFTLVGHTGWVTCIAFSPDGTRIASGSDDCTICLWSSATGKLLSTLNGHTAWVNSIAFSPDGTRIASGSDDRTVCLWLSNTGEQLFTLNGHTDWVTCIAFTPNGTRVASGSHDFSICLWSSDTGELLSTLNGHAAWVTCIAFSPDGTYIASGSHDHIVCLWSSDTGILLFTLHGHRDWVTCITFSPDGSRVASGSDDCTIHLWSSSMGELLSTLNGHTNWVTSIAFSPDGSHIASGSDDCTVRLWSSDTGELLSTLNGPTGRVTCVAFSPDGTNIASGSDDRTLCLWSSDMGTLLSTLNSHTSSQVTSLAFSPDGTHIASGSGDCNIRLWSNTGSLLCTLSGRTGWVTCIALSPDGARIASGSDDCTVCIWASDTGELLFTLNGHTAWVTCIAFSPDGTRIASASDDQSVRLWLSGTGQLLSALNHPGRVSSIAFSPDGTHVVFRDASQNVLQWSVNHGHLTSQYQGVHVLDNSMGASSEVLDINDDGWVVYGTRRLCWIPHANRTWRREQHIISSSGRQFCIGSSSTLIILDLSMPVGFGVSE